MKTNASASNFEHIVHASSGINPANGRNEIAGLIGDNGATGTDTMIKKLGSQKTYLLTQQAKPLFVNKKTLLI